MTMTYDGTNGITFPDSSLQKTAGYSPFRNRIINGDMRIDQRNSGASGTAAGYTVDRWAYYYTQASKGTWQQNAGSVTPPVGFKNYLGFTSSSAYSVISTDYFLFSQAIEGLNLADMGFGTANAATFTISFWVRSSLTGTFGGSVCNVANDRSYPFSYTINSANTWEQKSVTVAGDTTGTWLTTNGSGINLYFCFGAGSENIATAGAWTTGFKCAPTGQTSVVGTNGATFYITGVQLEKGSVATPFEYRPYVTELALCQRYYYQSWGSGSFANNGNTFFGMPIPNVLSASIGSTTFPVTMRATPTVTLYDNSGASGKASQPGLADGLISTAAAVGSNGFQQVSKTTTAYTTGSPVSAQYISSAEL